MDTTVGDLLVEIDIKYFTTLPTYKSNISYSCYLDRWIWVYIQVPCCIQGF